GENVNEGRTARIAAMTVDAVGVLCNTLLIIAILVDPLNVLRKGAWFTILNLSIADLIAALSNFMNIGLRTEFESTNSVTLAVFNFFWMFGASGSFMLLTLLTIQTYVIVKYPIRSRLMISGKKIGLACAVIWILAFLLGLGNVAYLDFADIHIKFAQLMTIYIAQVAVLELAVVVQVILKVLIIREIMKSGLNTEVNAEHRNNKHKEIAKTIVMLNVILIVTALPYFVAKQMEYLWRVDTIVAVCWHSCISVVINVICGMIAQQEVREQQRPSNPDHLFEQ
ncbi:5-hydroxytryptamine receptor 2A-like, partial [Paramuricea clavata]